VLLFAGVLVLAEFKPAPFETRKGCGTQKSIGRCCGEIFGRWNLRIRSEKLAVF
jgi:hypothetical protein